MLMRLLRMHLGRYRNTLLLVVVLQTVQTSAALALPTVNARIIDNGVLPGDVGYIWTWGAVMLFFALVQFSFSVAGVFYGGLVVATLGLLLWDRFGVVARAAVRLKMRRTTLVEKLRKYGMQRSEEATEI